jgi:hypothetical protein
LTLLKAVCKGFVKGCPNLSEKLILQHINPSPATAKGHMKKPHHGIKSTQTKPPQPLAVSPIVTTLPAPILPSAPYAFPPAAVQPHPILHQENAHALPHMILDEGNASIANAFCFSAFANAHTGVVYSNLTSNFPPFMLFDGSVCFHVMYHYKSNAILPTPISGLDDVCIFNAYKKSFGKLTSKGFKPRLNVMDNQRTKFIKKNTKEECMLQLMEPHNHCVNATKHTIQTFKDAFIAALATTDHDFPLQLWDKLIP